METRFFINVVQSHSNKVGETVGEAMRKKWNNTVITDAQWLDVIKFAEYALKIAREEFPRCKPGELRGRDYDNMLQGLKYHSLSLEDCGGAQGYPAFYIKTTLVREVPAQVEI